MTKRYSSWKNPPPVSFVSGSETFLCRRVLDKALRACAETGRRVETVGGQEGLLDVLSSSVLFTEPVLVVVTEPQAVDVGWVEGHKDNTIAVLVYYPKDTTKGMADLVEAVPKPYRFTFKKPTPWKAEELAVAFAVDEAKRYGKTISEALAKSLVGKVGTDLGILAFELRKVSALLDARGGGSEITPPFLMQTMVLQGEANIGNVVDAVGAGSVRKTLRALDQVKKNWSQGDPTLAVVAWLGNRATSWLHVAVISEQGADEKEGASRTGLNPYVYSHFTLPVASRWGRLRLIKLLHRLAVVEASVRQGKIDPWILLESVLVASVRGVGAYR